VKGKQDGRISKPDTCPSNAAESLSSTITHNENIRHATKQHGGIQINSKI
jgi:hypothetical protein